MQTTLIRDESIVALSVDLPEQQRFAAVRAAIGGLLGPDHSKRTGEILRAANYAEEDQQRRVDSLQVELGRALSDLTEARSAPKRCKQLGMLSCPCHPSEGRGLKRSGATLRRSGQCCSKWRTRELSPRPLLPS
jgi:hypothetical protein